MKIKFAVFVAAPAVVEIELEGEAGPAGQIIKSVRTVGDRSPVTLTAIPLNLPEGMHTTKVATTMLGGWLMEQISTQVKAGMEAAQGQPAGSEPVKKEYVQ